jgi:hypothetical protein
MMKYYKIVVNEHDDTGIDFNAFVDVPAHLKGFIAFGKGQERYKFNEEKRIVTGVMISVGTPIYRNSNDLGEHYVFFDAPTVDLIRRKFFKNGFVQNLNKDHDPNQITKGAVLIDSYIISSTDPKLPNPPEAFENQKLQDGTWIASYQIVDDNLWEEVKSGKFNGFSVEGLFEKKEVKIKSNINMSKQTKSIWDLFKKDKPNAEKFATATTAEGVAVSWEGDLVEGTAVTIDMDGEILPAPEGEHQVTLEDGTVKVIVLDAAGLVVSVADVEMNEDENGATKEEVADAMRSMMSEVNDRFNAIEAKNTELATENAQLKSEIESFKASGKFGSNPKKTDGEEKRISISEMIKNAKK